MGPSRRMQKQGMPDALDESKFAKKRKFGKPQDAEKQSKKLKTGKGGVIPAAKNVNGKAKNSGAQASTKGKFASNGLNGKPSKKSKLEEAAEDDLDDELDGGMESFDEDVEDLDDLSDGIGDMDALGSADEESLQDDEFIDSDDPDVQKAMWSEDEDASDAEEMLTAANIEGLSGKLDAQAAQQEEDAQAELEDAALQTNIAADIAQDPNKGLIAPDLQMVRNRITETTRVLTNFSELGEEGKSRADYVNQLMDDVCTYYGYSKFLAEKLWNLFPPTEALAFFDANETPRPLVIRTNTLRSHRRELAHALINRGVTLEPVGKWSKVGLQVFESQVPLGATPEYLAGHYILQAASSFLPVMALAPQEGERCLDMAAAPGGKTTYMAALMRNTGSIFANDSNKDRAKALIGNIHRLGVKNTIVCHYSALEFPRVMGGFDRILLDAPCSGTGVIAKDASVKTNKTEADFMKLPHLQKQLLLAAIDSVDHASSTGGYVVYSTCSVTVEENEQVVQYVLNTRPNVKLVETGLVFGKEGFTSYRGKKFHPSMKMTRRYYPHAYNVDGFFVSKFKKTGPTPPNAVRAQGQVKANGAATNGMVEEAPVDKTPIASEDGKTDEEDDFGGFDSEEDKAYMEKAKKHNMKRKGINPKAVGVNGKANKGGKNKSR
ncbi:25S rRNA (cytosine-C(5))-methyltransferase nop2 [Elsinoe australis]|uniref:Nucleolar protein 2 n=1 Tax=Elsinoe australis TaxID=40998 RepID=A0A2P8A7V6_9PEZI|nr:25S rRNA (cytosine-C(5))-methyltransferase nop2 [Elsinoe australis]